MLDKLNDSLTKKYYHLRPLIPRNIQLSIRRAIINRKKHLHKDIWPIDKRAAAVPDGWGGWPDNKKFALVLTHDVETREGHEKCDKLMKLEQKLGFRSSFNFIPEKYSVSSELRHSLTNNGFEVGVHDLYHDGKLYKSPEMFKKRSVRINQYLKDWGCAGFRSGSMFRNLDWIHRLDIEYDASTFDTDPFEPQSIGVRTIFPFIVSDNSNGNSYVELPYTLPQDFTLFVLMKEQTIDIWKKKLDWIAQCGGMALVITHPDYMNFNEGHTINSEYPAKFYREFLTYVKENYEGQYWHGLPKNLVKFCKNSIGTVSNESGNKYAQINNRENLSLDKKIWIDLDNSPHVPFFKPIMRELRKKGYNVAVTARDCSQTCGLADRFDVKYRRIGRHFGKNKILKVLGLLIRSFLLIPFILKEKPSLSVSHGSRAQILISKLFGIKSINIFDYEHTQGLLFIYPDYSLSPEIISPNESDRKKTHFLSYPGIKEDVYVPEFNPDSGIFKDLKIDESKLLVTIRPPATQAHYHNPEAETLLKAVIDYIGQNKNVCMVLMPRYKEQVDFIKKTWPELCSDGQLIIPDQVVDGLNLMWHSDLVVSGGGTMNREATALGVPVYSIFKGTKGAVDLYLSKTGKLTFLENIEDVRSKIKVERRQRVKDQDQTKEKTLNSIVGCIKSIMESL